MLKSTAELHELQQLASARLGPLARPAAQMERQRDIFDTPQAWQQIVKLKDEPDLVAADACQVIIGKTREILPVDEDLAAGRPIEAADQVQQRRLSGSGWADNRHHLATADVDRHAIERRDVAAGAGKLLGHISELNHGGGPFSVPDGREP